ncbi:S8 family peptidase [Clostridium oceanicum]|uniref:S8 family peptidase n=1 Tax=Clostridium oceanicum TaxID=1543 RepID=A0ABP3UMP1_9CLOT
MDKKNLPVKIILQRKNDLVANIGMGNTKFFCDVNEKLKNTIIKQLENTVDYYKDIFNVSSKLPLMGKIKMKKEAIAKSYKPDRFCKNIPIIGSGNLDEIYFKFTKDEVENTISEIQRLPSKLFKANLTSIEKITPYYSDDKISDDLRSKAKSKKEFFKIKDSIKIKLFDFKDDYDNELIRHYVYKKLNDIGFDEGIKNINYYDKVKYLQVKVQNYDQIIKISKINGIKTIDYFHRLYAVNKEIDYEDRNFKLPDKLIETDTIIGIIDTGISDSNPYLKNYIYSREQYVADEYINPSHGTFVASIIQYGDILNNINTSNKKLFKFLDVVALPNNDSTHGLIDGISEIEIMEIIDEVVDKYHDKVKIWNLSFGNDMKTCKETMSDLGVFCDAIQEKYNVQFFIASGNKSSTPLRQWPSQLSDDSDRIISPADSVRAITVGSIAHRESNNSLVKINEPSPFSRRGPGANYIVKPNVVDYGGNCTKSGNYNEIGMLGLDINGKITEKIGTSFSTPRVVRKYASIIDEMNETDILLSKGMLIHSAKMNARDLFHYNQDNIKYYGFGIPGVDVNNILLCSESEVTLVFKQKIVSGSHLELMDFPYPESLIKNGKYFGQICMTLVYNPPLNEDYGQEYCRSNIDVGFGPYKRNSDGKLDYKSEVPIEKSWESKYEADQVEHGFKWSPIKSYYRELKRGIKVADGWKLRVDTHKRYQEDLISQEFVLILTIRDKSGTLDIYSEVINGLRTNGYIMNDLELRSQVRVRN